MAGEKSIAQIMQEQAAIAQTASGIANSARANANAGLAALGDDRTEVLLNKHGWQIKFTSVPTGQSVSFKAFVTKFSDTYSPSWDEKHVYGRMDPIPTFNRVGRKISIGWRIPAFSPLEGADNLTRCSTLASMLYPVYNTEKEGVSYIAGAPLLRFYFVQMGNNTPKGNLLGYINGAVSIVPQYEEGVFSEMWDNAIPKLIDLSIDFTILHDFDLGWDLNKKLRTPEYNRYGNFTTALVEKKEQVDENVKSPSSDTPKSERQSEAAESTITANASTRRGSGDGMVGKS